MGTYAWKGGSFPRRATENQLEAGGLKGIRLVDRGAEPVPLAGLWQLYALVLATTLVGTLVCHPLQAGLTSEAFSHRGGNNEDNPVRVCSISVSTNAFTDTLTSESTRT